MKKKSEFPRFFFAVAGAAIINCYRYWGKKDVPTQFPGLVGQAKLFLKEIGSSRVAWNLEIIINWEISVEKVPTQNSSLSQNLP